MFGGRGGGLSAFGVQDSLQGVALRGGPPDCAFGGCNALSGCRGVLLGASAFGFVLAGRPPGYPFGFLSTLLRCGGLLNGLLTCGDRSFGLVLGGGGAPFGSGDTFGGTLFGGRGGSAGLFGGLLGGIDLGERASSRSGQRLVEGGQLSRPLFTCAQ